MSNTKEERIGKPKRRERKKACFHSFLQVTHTNTILYLLFRLHESDTLVFVFHISNLVKRFLKKTGSDNVIETLFIGANLEIGKIISSKCC